MDITEDLIQDLEFNLKLLMQWQTKLTMKIKQGREGLRAKEEQLKYEEDKLKRVQNRRGAGGMKEEVVRRQNSVQAVKKTILQKKEALEAQLADEKITAEKIKRVQEEIKTMKCKNQ